MAIQSWELEKDCISVHMLPFPHTLNFEIFCMQTHKSICLSQLGAWKKLHLTV
eukprot:UN23210